MQSLSKKINNFFETIYDYDKGAVYAICNYNTGLTKIGISKQPKRRLRQIYLASGCDVDFLIWNDITYSCELTAEEIEKALHKKYAKHRVVGEWFKLDEKNQTQLAIDLIELTEPI